MAMHARRWTAHSTGKHSRRWHTLAGDIGLLKRLLNDSAPATADIANRRKIVADELTVQFKALENTPSRRGRPKRNIDIRWRAA